MSMRLLCLGAVSAIMVGCGTSSIVPPGDGPVGGFIDAPINPADAGPCTGATSCPLGQVCNPANNMCVTTLGCTTHMQCGNEAFCNPSGQCELNQPHGPCDVDGNCIGQETCDNHVCGCGGQLLSTEVVIPNVLIAIDRSDSMNQPAGAGQPSKWEVAKSAVTTITDTYGDRIRFGLDLWPGTNQACNTGGNCSGGVVTVDVGANTATAIQSSINGASTCSYGTPITGALNFIAGYAGLEDTTHNNYVLFMTDGMQQSCTGDFVAAATALRTSTPPVETFVVGFGGGVSCTELNNLAVAGGRPRPGTPSCPGTPVYYAANNPTELNTAFDEIVSSVVSCSFTLSTVPPDVNRLYIYFGTTLIPRDTTHMNGWDYDSGSMQLTFYGTTCDQVRNGTTGGDLVVSYGCPIIP